MTTGDPTKTEVMPIRLTATRKAAYKAAAAAKGLKLSDWARMHLDRASGFADGDPGGTVRVRR